MSRGDEGIRHWLALLRAPGVGPVRYAEWLERCGEPRELFDNPGQASSEPRLKAYLQAPDWGAVEADLAWQAEAPGRHIITRADSRYPSLLLTIADPPPLLYLQGDLDVLDQPQLAMVGSRNPSRLGAETARDFASHLAGIGLAITSGLAAGIDSEAHRGALAGGGPTLAVLGTGPDRVYPAANRELAHAIVDNGGALVSEYPPGTPPLAANFPRRNRIISGLSLGTLVVEAALRSGSLITARMAMEQGREVFAIPGSIHNPLARGCHGLIREGAKLVESADHILEELAPQLRNLLQQDQQVPPGASEEAEGELDADYRRLLDCLGHESCPVDRLVERSGLTAEAVSSMLLLLELRGLVVAVPGGYSLAGKRR